LGHFEFNVSLVEHVLKHLRHFPNIEQITWSGASEVETLYILKETKQISTQLDETREKFKEIKEELNKNEATIDLSRFESIEVDLLLVYVLKSLEKLDNIITINLPQTCFLPSSDPSRMDLMNKIDEKLNNNARMQLDREASKCETISSSSPFGRDDKEKRFLNKRRISMAFIIGLVTFVSIGFIVLTSVLVAMNKRK
jgi:hypothetical protein